MGRIRPNENMIKGCILVFVMFVMLQFLNEDWNVFNLHLTDETSKDDDSVADYLKVKRYVPGELKKIPPPMDIEVIEKVKSDRLTDVDFRIIVITFNRPHSLLRLLNSLNKVDYLNDKVVVEIWIDKPKDGEIDDLTYEVSKRFRFISGHVTVHNQSEHAGIYGQWIWTWQPKKDSKEICALLEDDLSVSPFFYRYLKKVHQKYDERPYVNGYALQGVSLKHGGAKGNLNAPFENIVHLYPILGSWGFSPNAKNWVGFQNWFKEANKNKTFLPLVPGILPSLWYRNSYKKGEHENIWTMWHIYYAYMKKELTLYPNYSGKRGFTINWRENGLHFSKALTVGDPLVESWDERLDSLPDEPVRLDCNGTVVRN